MEQPKEKILLLIDNAPTHQSTQSKRVMKSLGTNVVFLPPYSPEMAPIELMFRSLKAKIRASKKSYGVNFSKVEGAKLITATLGSLKNSSWEKAWLAVVAHLRQIIAKASEDNVMC